jgi:hypothetical protein
MQGLRMVWLAHIGRISLTLTLSGLLNVRMPPPVGGFVTHAGIASIRMACSLWC